MIKKILPILFIILVWSIFSKPFILEQKIPFPADLQNNTFSLWSTYPELLGPVKNPAQPDVINQIIPWRKLTIESLKSGQIPFWNPYSFSGTPHLANYQSSPFSITNIFYFIFDFNIAWGIAVLIQPLLAGILTYFLLRSFKRSELASLFSAVSFMFCGFIVTWMSYTTLSLAICFLPIALFGIEKYFQSKNYFYLLIISLSFPLSFFSGHFQTSLYFAIIVISYTFFKFLQTKYLTKTLQVYLFSFFGILFSAPQILPSIELYNLSVRSSFFEKIEAVPIKYLITVIAPDYYGNPVTRNVSLGSYAEWASFFGTIPFLISLYSLFRKNSYVLFFSIAGTIALFLSLDSIILNLLVKSQIPVLSTSAASRALVIFSFSFSVLAGFGLDYLRKDLTNKTVKRMLIWILVCTIIFIFTWAVSFTNHLGPINYPVALKNLIIPTFLFATLVILIFIGLLINRLIIFILVAILLISSFDSLRFAIKWQTFNNSNLIFKETKIISELKKLDKSYRFHGAFGAEGSIYFGNPGTEGYDPLYINRYGQFISSLNHGKINNPPNKGVALPTNSKYLPKVIDFMGIKYVVLKESDKGKPWAFPFNNFPEKFKLIHHDKHFSIYENKDAFPKASLVGDYVVETNSQKIIDKLLDKDFDLRKNVILENNPKINKSKNQAGKATITYYSPNKIIISTTSNDNSILILNDNFYPGWKVKVNGEENEVLRANYTFRAVPIQKGENSVEFYYDSQYFNLGVFLAALSFFSILTIFASKWYTNFIWSRKHKTVISVSRLFAKTANGRQAKQKQKK